MGVHPPLHGASSLAEGDRGGVELRALTPTRRATPAVLPLQGEVQDDSRVAGAALVADCAGALYWPDESLLVVADLHLEKGSAFAARGVLLPPYDTAATLGAARHAHRALCAASCHRAGRQFS